MLSKRIDLTESVAASARLIRNRSLVNNDKYDIRLRCKILLDLEGWYECEIDPTLVPARWLEAYKASGSRLKITRWLLREGLITNQQASELGTKLKPVSFKLSCRHNDIMRVADTPHYASCMDSWRGIQLIRYLADPDIALVYVPDASGKFVWRAFIRAMLDGEKYCLLVYRTYGNTNEELILNRLNNIMPVYICQPTGKELKSVTVHNNPIVGKFVWTDHKATLRNGHIYMRGVRYGMPNSDDRKSPMRDVWEDY